MAWLTGFQHRMSCPVANPTTAGDRALDAVPFPAAFLLAQGRITSATFADVHVTKADGTTEIPCKVNASRSALYIDYAAMPQGRSEVFVYYGNSGASAPAAIAYYTPERYARGIVGPSTVDAGMEDGVDGAALSSAWTIGGTPTTNTYDSPAFGAAVGNVCGLLRSSATNQGVWPAAALGLTSDGAELRFWYYFENTTAERYLFGAESARPQYIRFAADGKVYVYTQKTATGYTTNNWTQVAASYSTGWHQFKIVYNFTAQTYTLWTRATAGASWTQLGVSGYMNIPMYASSTVTACNSPRAYLNNANVNLWFDEFRYSNSGIADTTPTATSTTVQVIGANAEVTAEDDTSPTYYVYGADIDATYLDSGAVDAFYGSETSLRAGATSAEREYHALLKFFEGALPTGTVASANLYVYATPTGACDLRAYPLKTYGAYVNNASYDYAVEPVMTGWSVQTVEQLPTWNTRMRDTSFIPAVPWQTAGATNANEIDTSVYSTLTIASGATAAYQPIPIDSSVMQGWLGDDYSQGVLVKHNGGTGDRFATFPAPGQANGPVLVVEFSALDAEQVSGRKLTTDTHFATNSYSHNRFASCDSADGFMVMSWPDGDRGLGIALVSADGRIGRVARGEAPAGGRFSYNNPFFGLHFDTSTGRYWIAGTDYASLSSFLCVAYSEPYDPSSWTWDSHDTLVIAKSSPLAINGVVHLAACDAVNKKVVYLTYTIADGFSAATELYTATVAGTERTLASGIDAATAMAGSGVISASGTIGDYPDFGLLLVESEFFWYTGKSGNTFTGVTRACYRTTAATHASGATIERMMGTGIPTYTAMSHDPVLDCIHLIWSHNRGKYSGTGAVQPGVGEYQACVYMRHYLTDAAGVWKDEGASAITLPMGPVTANLISSADTPHFPFSLTCNSQGDLLVCYRIYGTPADNAQYNRTGYGYMKAGQTAFTDVVDAVGTYRMWGVGVDLGGSSLAMVYETNATNDTTAPNGMAIGAAISIDSGESWDGGSVVDSHSWTQPYGWATGVSEQALVDSSGLAYINQMGMYGGLYLTTVQLDLLPPTDVVAAIDGTDVAVTFTDNAVAEDGFYAERSLDGAAFEVFATLAANSTGFTDTTLPAGWASVAYRVAAYKGSMVSAWATSNTVTAVSKRRRYVLLDPFAPTRM